MNQLTNTYQMLLRNSLKNDTSVKEVYTYFNGRTIIEIPLKGRFVALIGVFETITLTFHEVWTDNEGRLITRKIRINSVNLPECLREIVNAIPYKFEINLDKGNLGISEIVKIISSDKEKLYELCVQNSKTRTNRLNYSPSKIKL